MLIDGELDAAIYGAAMPRRLAATKRDPGPGPAAHDWYCKYGLVPLNHMVVVTEHLARSNPQAVVELYRLLEEGKKAAGIPAGGIDTAPFGKETNRPCLELLSSYAAQQSLLSRRIAFDALW